MESLLPDEGARHAGERYGTLLELGRALATSASPEAAFRATVAALRPVLPFELGGLFLHDAATGGLRLAALASALTSTDFAVGLAVRLDDEQVGRAFRERRPVLGDPPGGVWTRAGIRSLFSVPLQVPGRVTGTLTVASTAAGRYAEADGDLLQQVASQLATAVDSLSAHEAVSVLEGRAASAIERSRTLLEINNAVVSNLTQEALFHAISEALRRVVPFDRTALFLHDRERDVLRLFLLESARPSRYFTVGLEMAPGESHVGWVFSHRQPLVRHDLARERQFPMEDRAYEDGIRAYVIVPLLIRGEAIGTLAVASTTPGQYAESDVACLQEAATQIALAVENMRSYEEIAALKTRLEHENVYLQEEIRREHNFDEMIGDSPALLEVLRRVARVAPTDTTVLVCGETGTGKELIARALHSQSGRRDRPLVKVNCGAISAGLVESELFGHVKGAFTGALERRVGRFELAHGGTLFLDEVGELPLETQVKLLRVLQEQEFEPVGSSQTIRVDVRVIAATGRDLEEAVRAGRVRADLFYRLNVFSLRVPPLSERRADIPQLVAFFLDRLGRQLGKRVEGVSPESMERLVRYPWPGNVRELRNVIERSLVLCQGPLVTLDADLLPAAAPPAGRVETADDRPGAPVPANSLEAVERRHILNVLAETDGIIEGPKGAARILSLHPNTLRSRMKKLGITRPRARHDRS
jgi:formate hydrogenlyase transcriptional activator